MRVLRTSSSDTNPPKQLPGMGTLAQCGFKNRQKPPKTHHKPASTGTIGVSVLVTAVRDVWQA